MFNSRSGGAWLVQTSASFLFSRSRAKTAFQQFSVQLQTQLAPPLQKLVPVAQANPLLSFSPSFENTISSQSLQHQSRIRVACSTFHGVELEWHFQHFRVQLQTPARTSASETHSKTGFRFVSSTVGVELEWHFQHFKSFTVKPFGVKFFPKCFWRNGLR